MNDSKPEAVKDTVSDAEPEQVADVAAEPDGEVEAETGEVDPEQLIVEAKAEATKNWDLYLRERADLENYRKRSQREKEEAIRFANDRLLRELIPVLDNLERAVEHAEAGNGGSEGLLEGVDMTINMFRKALEDFGVKPIVAIGEIFDPNHHQAMGHAETDDCPPNTVSAEFQKGYLLHDRLLRPSLVMVAKAPAVDSAEQTTEQTSETTEGDEGVS
ncbi:MAG: nucleotide exchange factor GrpE [Desulfuromonadales bacterium]|nr:nucleotide exchange factor GrpE [Desulfuromonadales bacterium]